MRALRIAPDTTVTELNLPEPGAHCPSRSRSGTSPAHRGSRARRGRGDGAWRTPWPSTTRCSAGGPSPRWPERRGRAVAATCSPTWRLHDRRQRLPVTVSAPAAALRRRRSLAARRRCHVHLRLAHLLAQGRDLRVLRRRRNRLGPLGLFRRLDPLPQRLVVHIQLGGNARDGPARRTGPTPPRRPGTVPSTCRSPPGTPLPGLEIWCRGVRGGGGRPLARRCGGDRSSA